MVLYNWCCCVCLCVCVVFVCLMWLYVLFVMFCVTLYVLLFGGCLRVMCVCAFLCELLSGSVWCASVCVYVLMVSLFNAVLCACV